MFRLSGGIQSDRYSLPLRFSGRDFSANVLAHRLAALSLTEWHYPSLSYRAHPESPESQEHQVTDATSGH
jgi:hypothetical protein